MKKLTRLTNLYVVRHTKRFVFLRMALGILLFTKGFDFINNTAPLQELLSQQKKPGAAQPLVVFCCRLHTDAWSSFYCAGIIYKGCMFYTITDCNNCIAHQVFQLYFIGLCVV